MELLLDADALIKLNRAGVLERIVEAFDCAIPHEVYQEAVVKGKERGHCDAEEIAKIFESGIEVRAPVFVLEQDLRLDSGESAVLALVSQGQAQIIVSDDRQFVSFLSRAGIPHLVPAALIVVMARQHIFTRDGAIGALNRFRPLIRVDSCIEALQELEKLENNEH